MDKLLGYLLVGIIGYVVVVALLNTLGIPELLFYYSYWCFLRSISMVYKMLPN